MNTSTGTQYLRMLLSFQLVILLGCMRSYAAEPQNGAAIESAVKTAYEKEKNDMSGKNADFIPELAKVPSDLFAVTVVTMGVKVHSFGDDSHPFSIQSCCKVFAICHVPQEYTYYFGIGYES